MIPAQFGFSCHTNTNLVQELQPSGRIGGRRGHQEGTKLLEISCLEQNSLLNALAPLKLWAYIVLFSLLLPFSELTFKCLHILHIQAEMGSAVLSSQSSYLLWTGLWFLVDPTQEIHQCPRHPRREGLLLPTNLSNSNKGYPPTLA